MRVGHGKENTVIRRLTVRLFAAAILSLLLAPAVGGCAAGDDGKTPVFFVHGHGMSPESFDAMIAHLERAGYPRMYLRAIRLSPNTGANIDAAENQIRPSIENYLSEINAFLEKKRPDLVPKTRVDLVSHSMGGLSSRWYAAKVRPDRVRVWLSLAGANHGTDALCTYFDAGAIDLCPAYARDEQESYVQFHLNGKPRVADIDETPYGLGADSPGVRSVPPAAARSILYVTIRTTPDRWLVPEDTAVLDGAGMRGLQIPAGVRARETSPGNFLMTHRVGHDEMLADPETMDLIVSILGQADRLLNGK